MEKRLAEGVPVDPVTWEGILEAGEQVGLPRSEATALVSNALIPGPCGGGHSDRGVPACSRTGFVVRQGSGAECLLAVRSRVKRASGTRLHRMVRPESRMVLY